MRYARRIAVLLFVLIASALVYSQLSRYLLLTKLSGHRYCYGWPWPYHLSIVSIRAPFETKERVWITLWLLWDATYSVLILIGTGFSLYRWSDAAHRLTLVELLAITGVVGIWLAIWRARPMYAAPLREAWFIQIPVAFGVGCLLFAALVGILFWLKRLRAEFTADK